jgi:elongation factor Ts
MSNISASKIKELRDKTGAGMMDCKNALVENDGNLDNATSWLRKKGIANADKKSSRTASEGLVGLKTNHEICVMVEINTETDFVSKNKDFQEYVEKILDICSTKVFTIEELLTQKYDESYNIAEALKNLIAKIGENIVIRRLVYLTNHEGQYTFGSYIHNKINNHLGKMSCVIKLKTLVPSEEVTSLANKIAMHITASKPLAINESELSPDLISKEKEIFIAQLKESGKPDNIIEKIVDGKIKKYLSEVTLINQNWIMDPSFKVKDIINTFNEKNNSNIVIADFKLFILGEGIEVSEKNFSEEVASQLNNTS